MPGQRDHDEPFANPTFRPLFPGPRPVKLIHMQDGTGVRSGVEAKDAEIRQRMLVFHR